jgi:DNA-binding NtrC family response regulator
MKHEQIQTIICEDHLPISTQETILKLARHRPKPIPVIITSRTGEWKEFLRALSRGAFDCLALLPRSREVARIVELTFAEFQHASEKDAEFARSPEFSAAELALANGRSNLVDTAFAKAAQKWAIESRLPNRVARR